MSVSAPFSIGVKLLGNGLNSPNTIPHSVEIIQAEYNMDIAYITVWGGDVTSNSVQSGVPLQITWGSNNAARSFYGYVNHAERANQQLAGKSAVERNSTTIVAVGASWPMKEKNSTQWGSTTTSLVLQQMAQAYGLGLNSVDDSVTWPSLSQAGISDWTFCVDLAKRVGYSFYCSGTMLIYKPRTTNPTQLQSLAAVYDMRANPAAMPVFNPQLGATSPAGGQLANRRLGGINPRTVSPIISQVSGSNTPTNMGNFQDTPVFTQIDTGVVNSQAEADGRTSGAAALNQLYITATATVGGNPLISQGSLIYVANGNGAQNGLWYVTKATHRITPKAYQVDLELGRDSLGASASISSLPLISLPAAPRLVGTTWMAA